MKIEKITFIVGWLFSSVVYAQETKEVIERDNVFTERFSVLKADKRSKQGRYQWSSGERDMDAEALRVINLYSGLQWVPGEWKGRNVSTFITQPVRFNNMGVINRPR